MCVVSYIATQYFTGAVAKVRAKVKVSSYHSHHRQIRETVSGDRGRATGPRRWIRAARRPGALRRSRDAPFRGLRQCYEG